MVTLAKFMAHVIVLSCKEELFDDGVLSDECDDEIAKRVKAMSSAELLELIWTAESFDDTFIDPAMSDGPRDMLRRLALCCIRSEIKSDKLFQH